VRVQAVTAAELDAIESRLEDELLGLPTLEGAAQRATEILYESLRESCLLVRAFAVVPFEQLTPDLQRTAEQAVRRRNPGLALSGRTPVLALLGTHGDEPAWNSRFSSRGHAAIPLVSVEFVEQIPMIARLLKELGAQFGGSRLLATDIVTQAMGAVAGTFYVEDARTEKDAAGRLIISAQDFVQEHGVRTVFGFGGAYASNTWLVLVLFTRETIPRRTAERFMRLVNVIKAATMRVAIGGRLFGDGPQENAPRRRRA
jgi:hypothetical protein